MSASRVGRRTEPCCDAFDGGAHDRLGGRTSGRAEIVPAPLKSERAFKTAELALRVEEPGGHGIGYSPFTGDLPERGTPDGIGSASDFHVTRIGLGPKALNDVLVLQSPQASGLPQEGGATALDDFVGKPFERLSRFGVGREHPYRVVEEHGT
jgi:hypothetical protein